MSNPRGTPMLFKVLRAAGRSGAGWRSAMCAISACPPPIRVCASTRPPSARTPHQFLRHRRVAVPPDGEARRAVVTDQLDDGL